MILSDTAERERLGDGEVLVPGARGELHGCCYALVPGERREPVHPLAYLGRERLVELVEAFRVLVVEQLDDPARLRGEIAGRSGAEPNQGVRVEPVDLLQLRA